MTEHDTNAGDQRRTEPHDYDATDGFDADRGLDQCPHCETIMSANGGYFGPVYDQRGTRYETIYDTDARDRPFFCESCWVELETNRRLNNNRSLADFTGGGVDG